MTRSLPSSPAPLNEVLQAAARQIEELSDRCATLQHTLSAVLPDDSTAWDAQALDLVTQRLASLAQFFGHLSEELPVDLEVNAAQATSALPLRHLARALSLQPLSATSPAGDLELFGEP